MRDLFDTSIILPKCWLARIPKYWDETIPTNIPRSSSSFSYVTTEAEKEAVEEMEENINNPETSIITPEALGEHNALGSYAGTYDVVANAGERTLLSPNKLVNASAALAYHYDERSDEWNQIEDAELDSNGYVWGSCESFSPVAVFGVRRDTYVEESNAIYAVPTFVCNGIATKIYKNDEDKIVAEDGYGKITEIDSSYLIIGGTTDGTDIESTNVAITGVELWKVIGGSAFLDHPVHVNTVNVYLKDSKFAKAITGTGVGCRVEKVNITVDGCESNGLGCGESFYMNKALNKTLADSALRLGAPQWIKEGDINVTNSKIQVAYTSASNGYSYVQNAVLKADNCEFEYFCNGQSNGTVDNCTSVVSNCKIDYLNSNNRGHYGSGKCTLKGCEIDKFFVFAADDEGAECADILGTVAWDVDAASTINEVIIGKAGNGGSHAVTTPDECAKYLEYLKLSRSTDVKKYADNAEFILGDKLVIK